jgi:hypothetical protein
MATTEDKGLFWNSNGGDRKYNADSLGKWLSKFFTTGVMPNDFQVTATGSNMKVTMGKGYVNIANPDGTIQGGKVRLFEENTEFTIDTADSVYPRIDTIVIERNDNDRDITAKYIKGTAAETPTATAPVRNTTTYQLVIAEIYVAAGASTISNSNITRKCADNTVCGIVTGTVSNNQITYGTTDLTPGVSELADGVIYFVYE